MDSPPVDGGALVAVVVLAAVANGIGVWSGHPMLGGIAALAVAVVGGGVLYGQARGWRPARESPGPE